MKMVIVQEGEEEIRRTSMCTVLPIWHVDLRG